MKAIIEKELCNPVSVNGYAEVPGPYYHVYGVDEQGNKTFYKTVDGDIKEAAREAERMLDLNLLEVACRENPHSLDSCVSPNNSFVAIDEVIRKAVGDSILKELHAWACDQYNLAEKLEADDAMLAFQEMKQKILSFM